MVSEEYKEQLLLAWDKEQQEKLERERAVSFAEIYIKRFKSNFVSRREKPRSTRMDSLIDRLGQLSAASFRHSSLSRLEARFQLGDVFSANQQEANVIGWRMSVECFCLGQHHQVAFW